MKWNNNSQQRHTYVLEFRTKRHTTIGGLEEQLLRDLVPLEVWENSFSTRTYYAYSCISAYLWQTITNHLQNLKSNFLATDSRNIHDKAVLYLTFVFRLWTFFEFACNAKEQVELFCAWPNKISPLSIRLFLSRISCCLPFSGSVFHFDMELLESQIARPHSCKVHFVAGFATSRWDE